jgi:hypothetical protein
MVNGNIELRLKTQLKGYARLDEPPERAKPIPMPLLAAAVAGAYSSSDPLLRATGDCTVIGLFSLLRPGEHVHSYQDNDTAPFRLQDVEFNFGIHCYNAATCDMDLLLCPDSVLLTYSKQKNGTLGEKLKHGSTGHPLMSPILAVLCRVRHLRQHHAPPATPLHTVYLPTDKTVNVTSNWLTAMLRRTCRQMPELGLSPSDISARCYYIGLIQ